MKKFSAYPPLTKASVIILAVFILAVALLRATGYWKSDFDRSNDSQKTEIVVKPDYSGIRAELAKVEVGDFVEYNGQLYIATGIGHATNEGEIDGITGVRLGDAIGTPIFYQYDEVAAKIGKVVRWNEGSDQIPLPNMVATPIGHEKWTVTAREFASRHR